MVSSSKLASTADGIAAIGNGEYFDVCRARVDWFVAKHFTWPGTLHLHTAALGWDILRAPINVTLSPILVLIRVLAFLCRRIGFPVAAEWLAGRAILLRTTVARRVEICIVTDLLDLPLPHGAADSDPDAVSRAVLAAPQIRDLIRMRESTADVLAVGRRIARALGDYAGTRSAVAEMTTAVVTLAVGALVFHALTPGLISMAPGVADAMARTTAISDFLLGQAIGAVWYGVFPAGASPWLVAATVVVLVMIGSIFTAFAGVLADPVQIRLGIHRRRLLRLIDVLEVELCGSGDKSFAAREHFYARFFDLWDAGASALRFFKN
jgi:hypothetical protein